MKEEKIEVQELYCHGCGRYVQFTLDLNLNGNYAIKCPNCGHVHYRVIRNGKITGIRWDPSLATYYLRGYTSTSSSTYSTYSTSTSAWGDSSGGYFLYELWLRSVIPATRIV